MATTSTFPDWLSRQQDRGDAVGGFAQQVAQLSDFPDSGGRAIFEGYFETALPAQQQAFERAWTEFESSPEPSTDDDAERPEGFR